MNFNPEQEQSRAKKQPLSLVLKIAFNVFLMTNLA